MRDRLTDEQEIPTRLWAIQDAAQFLGCSTKTVRELVRREGLPCLRLRSRLRFVPSDVLQWARRRGTEGR